MTLVTARAIGLMTMIDCGKRDHKILAVAVGDPEFNSFHDALDLPPHRLTMLRRFFQDYKQLEGKEVAVDEIQSADLALPIIEELAPTLQHDAPQGVPTGDARPMDRPPRGQWCGRDRRVKGSLAAGCSACSPIADTTRRAPTPRRHSPAWSPSTPQTRRQRRPGSAARIPMPSSIRPGSPGSTAANVIRKKRRAASRQEQP